MQRKLLNSNDTSLLPSSNRSSVESGYLSLSRVTQYVVYFVLFVENCEGVGKFAKAHLRLPPLLSLFVE